MNYGHGTLDCPKCGILAARRFVLLGGDGVRPTPSIRGVARCKILVEGQVSDVDYESGRDERLCCTECGAEFPASLPLEFV